MAAPDHRSVFEFVGFLFNDLKQLLDVGNENVGGLGHLHGKGRVDDVAAGQAEVEPAAGWRADVLAHVGREGNDVVVEGSLQLAAAVDGKIRPGFHQIEVLLGDDSLGDEGFRGQQFNLQPNLELALFAPDVPHFLP